MRLTRLATAAVLAALAGPTAAADVSYELINDSSLALAFFYTSPTTDPNWSQDLLGDANVLWPGETGTVTLFDASETCDFDVRFVFEDGQEVIDRVNVCDLASYTLVDAH